MLRLVSILIVCLISPFCWGEEQIIIVDIQGVEGELLDNVRGNLTLAQPQKHLSPTRLKLLYKQSPQQIEKALQPFGFYNPEITTNLIQIPDKENTWQATFQINVGEPILWDQIDIQITGDALEDEAFQKWQQDLPFSSGETFLHAEYETAKKQLLQLAEDRGYFQANLITHQVQVDEKEKQANLTLHFNSGRRYRFGQLTVKQNFLDEKVIEHLTPFKSGDPYLHKQLLSFQNALRNTDYFENVQVNTKKQDQEYLIDLDVNIVPQRQISYRGRLGYGTDTGLRVALDAPIRYVNDYGHRFIPSVGWSQNKNRFLGNMRYIAPIGKPEEEYIESILNFKAEDLTSSDLSLKDNTISGKTRVTDLHLKMNYHHPRNLGNVHLDEVLSLNYLIEKYDLLPLLFSESDQQLLKTLEGTEGFNLKPLSPNYKIFYIGLGWTFSRSDNALNISHGEKLSLHLKGAMKGAGSPVTFTQAYLNGIFIRPLFEKGKMILRSEAGYTHVETLNILDTLKANDLPKELQFRTGGDRTVRGFKYQEINGDSDSLVGGKHLLTGSVEYEHSFMDTLSAAVFLDVGNVFNKFQNIKLKQSIGTGLRWHSPVGIVRVDIAFPISKDDQGWRFHLVIGPEF
jgi:translocation and assembly module TamA